MLVLAQDQITSENGTSEEIDISGSKDISTKKEADEKQLELSEDEKKEIESAHKEMIEQVLTEQQQQEQLKQEEAAQIYKKYQRGQLGQRSDTGLEDRPTIRPVLDQTTMIQGGEKYSSQQQRVSEERGNAWKYERGEGVRSSGGTRSIGT